MEKISIETDMDSDRMLEIIKILVDRGFTLEKMENGMVTKISGEIKLDLVNLVQILNLQPC